jgi:hypothetical protein
MLAQVLMLSVAAAAGAGAAWTVQGWRHEAAMGKIVSRHAKDLANLVERQDSAATAYEVIKERERVVFQTIRQTVDRIVERETYRNICFDDDGVGVLNAAIRGGDATSSGSTAPAVPRTD